MNHDKKQIRVLHTSDLHLGEYYPENSCELDERAKRALKALVGFSVHAGSDLVIIAGDFFDNNRVGNMTVEFAVVELRKATVPVLILPGNHDCLASDSVYRRVCFSILAPNVRVFSALKGETFSFPNLDIAVWGKPISSYAGDVRPLEGIPRRGKEKWQIAVAHGYYTAHPHPLDGFQINDQEIVTSCRDYIALGHSPVFRFICNGPVKAFYSGSAAETGKVVIVDLADDIDIQVRCHSILR